MGVWWCEAWGCSGVKHGGLVVWGALLVTPLVIYLFNLKSE